MKITGLLPFLIHNSATAKAPLKPWMLSAGFPGQHAITIIIPAHAAYHDVQMEQRYFSSG